MDPAVLVLDEPTTGQDAGASTAMQRSSPSVAGAGRTVIAITHDMGFAAEILRADVVVCAAGRVALDGAPSEVFAESAWPTLAATYLEPPLAARIGSALGAGLDADRGRPRRRARGDAAERARTTAGSRTSHMAARRPSSILRVVMPPRRPARGRPTPRWLVVVVLLGIVLSACSPAEPSPKTTTVPSPGASGSLSPDASGAVTPSAPPVAKAKWTDCGSGFQCATIRVPKDYADPAKGTLQLALLRLPATDRANRIGSLLINPGGPGGSGVDFVRDGGSQFPSAIRKRFDLVGFDPRGVNTSSPVRCVDNLDPQADLDPSPDTSAELAALVDQSHQFADACARRNADVLPVPLDGRGGGRPRHDPGRRRRREAQLPGVLVRDPHRLDVRGQVPGEDPGDGPRRRARPLDRRGPAADGPGEGVRGRVAADARQVLQVQVMPVLRGRQVAQGL